MPQPSKEQPERHPLNSVMHIAVAPLRVTRVLAATIAGLVVLHVLGRVLRFGFDIDHAWGIVPLFNLNEEQNVPTLYAFVTLLLSSAILLLIGIATRQLGRAFATHWLVLSGVFCFLAVDEAISLHERFDEPIRQFFGVSGYLYYAWIIPYSIVLGCLALAYLPFLLHLSRAIAMRLVAAGAIFLTGALGFESLGGAVASAEGVMNVRYLFFSSVEETLEMLGILLLIHTLLTYIETEFGELRIAIVPSEDSKATAARAAQQPARRSDELNSLKTEVA